MVQNYFDFFANTLFWLSYIPFYERLFPVFAVNNEEESFRVTSGFKIRFRLPESGKELRSFEKKPGKEYEISFGNFSSLLRAFAQTFGSVKR
jgi:hypothetical protein